MKSERSERNEEATHRPAPVRFIAEVSSNHQRDLGRAIEFIDCAADIGCDGVKFQLFRIHELFAPEILERSPVHRARREWELPSAFLPRLAEQCQRRGIDFSCTPFYLEGVDDLAPFVDFMKIASYELLWDDLLKRAAATGLPIVLSTGMATLAEVRHAVSVLAAAGTRDLTLLHCVSGYPAPAEAAHLASIDTLFALGNDFESMRLRTGWSDHTVEAGVIQRAVHAHPTSMVEFHLDLEGKGDEFETGHCWLPEAMRQTIQDIRCGERAEGQPAKEPSPIEAAERPWRADPVDGLRPLRAIRAGWFPTP